MVALIISPGSRGLDLTAILGLSRHQDGDGETWTVQLLQLLLSRLASHEGCKNATLKLPDQILIKEWLFNALKRENDDG